MRAAPTKSEGALRATFVTRNEDADFNAVVVTLFRDTADSGRICGWCIGPIEAIAGRLVVPYVPPSMSILGAVAILHAFQFAIGRGLGVCVVDAGDLWHLVRYE